MQIEVALTQRERFADPQPGAPEHNDQAAEPDRLVVGAGGVHHGNDLLDARKVGWVPLAFVAWRAALMEAWQGRG